MNLRRSASILVATCLLSACAVEKESTIAPTVRGAVTGREQLLDYWYSVAIDCTSTGTPVIRTLTAPAHGTFRTSDGVDFPAFAESNPRHSCNSRKLPVAYLYYQSSLDFVGTDTATVEVLFPSGSLRNVSYSISVRR